MQNQPGMMCIGNTVNVSLNHYNFDTALCAVESMILSNEFVKIG